MRGDEAREERESIEKSLFESVRGKKKFSTIEDGILLSVLWPNYEDQCCDSRSIDDKLF